jgi:hypothetical protein
MPDLRPPDDDVAESRAENMNGPRPTDVDFGHFGSVRDGEVWTVVWEPDTHIVRAWPASASAGGPPEKRPKVLGRAPGLDYVEDTVAAITRAHGDAGWRAPRGLEELARWLTRLAVALDGEAWKWPGPLNMELRAFYLDYGHTRDEVDPADLELAATELWDDLDDLAAQARTLLNRLAVSLNGDGSLAGAALAAQDLVDVATAIHLALNDAYHVAHQRRPGRRPSQAS